MMWRESELPFLIPAMPAVKGLLSWPLGARACARRAPGGQISCYPYLLWHASVTGNDKLCAQDCVSVELSVSVGGGGASRTGQHVLAPCGVTLRTLVKIAHCTTVQARARFAIACMCICGVLPVALSHFLLVWASWMGHRHMMIGSTMAAIFAGHSCTAALHVLSAQHTICNTDLPQAWSCTQTAQCFVHLEL